MFSESNMMKTNSILERALDVESLRRRVISDNIANVDVPHFKRSEVNFESELRRAIKENEHIDENRVPATMTDEKHIPFFTEKDVQAVSPRVRLDYNTTYRNDGNNVDIEKEMVDASLNSMRYNAFVTSLNQNYKILKFSMRSVQ